jgi:hypothetical protein
LPFGNGLKPKHWRAFSDTFASKPALVLEFFYTLRLAYSVSAIMAVNFCDVRVRHPMACLSQKTRKLDLQIGFPLACRHAPTFSWMQCKFVVMSASHIRMVSQ